MTRPPRKNHENKNNKATTKTQTPQKHTQTHRNKTSLQENEHETKKTKRNITNTHNDFYCISF